MSRGGKLCRVFGSQFVFIMFAGLVAEPWRDLCALCVIILPFVGYIVVLYDFPLFTTMSPALRMACLTIFSIFATVTGIFAIMIFLGIGPTD